MIPGTMLTARSTISAAERRLTRPLIDATPSVTTTVNTDGSSQRIRSRTSSRIVLASSSSERVGPNEIGASDDADNSPVVHDGETIHPSGDHQCGRLADPATRFDRDRRRGHGLAGSDGRELGELGSRLVRLTQEAGERSVSNRIGSLLLHQQVGLGYDPDDIALHIDHGHATDGVLDEQHGDLFERRLAAHRSY